MEEEEEEEEGVRHGVTGGEDSLHTPVTFDLSEDKSWPF